MKLVFVYGTLRRGFLRHSAIADQRYLGVAFTEPKYSIFHISGFPALVEDSVSGKEIWGELYEVTLDCLSKLDEIEGVSSNLFRRQPIALARYNLLNIPMTKEIFLDLTKNTAEAYYYQKDVSGARDCGHCWTLR